MKDSETILSPKTRGSTAILLKPGFVKQDGAGGPDSDLACWEEARGHVLVCLCTRFFWASMIE